MPSFHTTRRVAHKASDMFALVADVERYPEFVPLCKGLRLLRREHHGSHETLTARMTVAYKLFTESFTSRVVLRPEEHAIVVDYLDGPFRKLHNRWTFTPAGEAASQVGFHLDYEFKSRAFQLLDGRRVRPRLPQVRRCVRGARQRRVRQAAARPGTAISRNRVSNRLKCACWPRR